jgi:predicted transcriptional regulator
MQAATELVSRFMRQPVLSVGLGASVQDALALAHEKGIHHIPIVQDGKLLGLVCTCDLKEALPHLPVLQLARRNVVTALPSCTAGDAARLMISNAVGSVVLSNCDGLWGIVTKKDLAEAGPELAELLTETVCAVCGAGQHLRPAVGETFLCVSCAERASASHWYDEGGGD